MLRRGGFEHLPRCRRRNTQWLEEHPNAARCVRVLVAIARIAIGLMHHHSGPACREFVRDNHRDRGTDALPHFGARDVQIDRAGAVDRQKYIRRKHRVIADGRLLRLRRASGAPAAPDIDAKNESGPTAKRLKRATTGQVNDMDQRVTPAAALTAATIR